MKTKRPINCCFPGLEASSSVEITFYPLNVGAEKLAAQEPVLGGEGPALPSRVGLVVKGQRRPQGVGFAPSVVAPSAPSCLHSPRIVLCSFWKLCATQSPFSRQFYFLRPFRAHFFWVQMHNTCCV